MFNLTPYTRRGLSKQDDFVDFYNMIDNFFNDSMRPLRYQTTENFKLDIKETENGYVIDAELPGFKKEDIKLDFNDGKLLISVSKQEEKNDGNEKYIHKERYYNSMQRGVYLPNVDSNQISAKFEDGILQIKAPKVPEIEKKAQICIE